MAKFKFAAKLYDGQADIHGRFRAHQTTIRRLAAEYRVGQEMMRQFLMQTMDDYAEVVRDLRRKLSLAGDLGAKSARLFARVPEPYEAARSSTRLVRQKSDLSVEELKEIERRLQHRLTETRVHYHEYIVHPLYGDA